MTAEHKIKLATAQIAAYRRDGLLVSPWRLPVKRIEQMRESLDRLMRDNAHIAPESFVCPHISYGQRHPPPAAARWFEYATEPAILDMVEQLIGPDIILWGSQVFCKPAGIGREVPWHQDGQYWPIRPRATCSVWIAIDDVTPNNGCMRYIPGSHKPGMVYAHRRSSREDVILDREVDPLMFDEAKSMDNILQAGQFSLHDIYLIHGSAANRSGRRRAGFVIRFMPATSTFERDGGDAHYQAQVSFSMSQRPIWLVRGRDHGDNDFRVGHGEHFRLDAGSPTQKN